MLQLYIKFDCFIFIFPPTDLLAMVFDCVQVLCFKIDRLGQNVKI